MYQCFILLFVAVILNVFVNIKLNNVKKVLYLTSVLKVHLIINQL
ncbi:MAG: hypothetical protein JWQ57_4418 [Mucilaginibacter sp.]|nr:hypothetical protein [Mucilaginibacter sp.]